MLWTKPQRFRPWSFGKEIAVARGAAGKTSRAAPARIRAVTVVAVFAAVLGADFEGPKIPLFGKRTKYFLHRFPIADDLVAILQRLKWLRHFVKVIELDRPRLMPRFKKRWVHEVAH